MENKILISKKGAAVPTVVVFIVIALVGAVMIGYLLYLISSSISPEREACRASVASRGAIPDLPHILVTDLGKIKEIPSLNCKTKNICVTSNLIIKPDCEKNLGSDYKTIRITFFEKDPENKIKSVIAREMAEAWGVFGEGKVQIFPTGMLKDKRQCFVYSVIDFDEGIQKNEKMKISLFEEEGGQEVRGDSGYWGFERYLFQYKVPDKEISYAEYFYGERFIQTPSITFFMDDNAANIQSFSSIKSPKAVVFMQTTQGDMTELVVPTSVTGGGLIGVAAGCWVGIKIGAIYGSFIPVKGNLIGAVVGGVIGCTSGLVLGGGTGAIAGAYVHHSWIDPEKEFASGIFLVDLDELKEFNCEFVSLSS
jgi:hypothetical protein